jgi:excisionase family DNA binding protein
MRSVLPNARRQGQKKGQRSPLLYTPNDIAKMAGLSLRTVRRHIADGRLPTLRIGGHVVITPAGARAWMGRELWPQGVVSAWARCVPISVLSRLLKKTDRAVRYQIDNGDIPTVRVGGRLYVTIKKPLVVSQSG